MKYYIFEEFIEEVEKKINRIAKKAKAHGCPFTYIRGEIVQLEKAVHDSDGNIIYGNEVDEYGNQLPLKAFFPFYEVEVEGVAKVDDWEFIATLEYHETGNIIRKCNTDVEVPDRFFHTLDVCDHCQTNRRRNNLYIIHNTKTDDWKQVGKNCLMLYTNGLNAELVTYWLDGITYLEECGGYNPPREKRYYNVKEIIQIAYEALNVNPYVNSESAEWGYTPTKQIVREIITFGVTNALEGSGLLYGINHYMRKENKSLYSFRDFYKDDSLEVVDEIIKYYLSLPSEGEFIQNIQSMIKSERVLSKNIGYLAYTPEGYRRYLDKEEKKRIEREAKKSFLSNNFFGEIGKRYKNLKVTAFNISASFETQFGTMHIVKFILENGNVLTWKTTSYVPSKIDSISFTVKQHEVYRNDYQTVISRPNFA